jgi:FKBP-type peptidyl-prolyl cis-trans isomerase
MNVNHSVAILCLLVGGVCGCETSQVAEQQDPPTPTAPAAAQSSAKAPGPQDPDAPEEFTTTNSGLKYRILRKATGRKPTSADSVTVNYKGWLDDGTVFDSSYERGEPITFELLGVIKGWTEGLQYVSEGGMIELEIPSELGYGARGAGSDVPPNATLHFIVELIEVQ